MAILIKNIKSLLQTGRKGQPYVSGLAMRELPSIADAWLLTEGAFIHSYGRMEEMPEVDEKTTVVDASGALVMPAFCDSHTHLVFPNTREVEYVDKINGLSYEEIAQRGGGILNSAKAIEKASEDQLYEDAMKRLDLITSYGTGAVEIKSGYGLTTASELKMLRAIKRLKAHSPLTIKSNFLGAHSIPMAYRGCQEKYVDLVVNEMLPAVAEENLADFVDVFCDKGFFTVEDTERILEKAVSYGMVPKIHANELDFSGGIQVGVKYNARSVDHLEFTGEAEMKALKGSGTMPTVLPGAAFFLGMQYAPVREMMDYGLPVAMASDYNPGSAPSGNMQLILSMASILYRMTPQEALNATTLNTAYAMGVEEELGSIDEGKRANLLMTHPINGIEYLPYAFGDNKVQKVIINGEIVKENE
ncbi:MAG: imidazolonepropionase [Bacteroidetes bacterium]|nr:MAG: imidazolonepropionase [Bacteroidota bacterium]PIE88429.1 MAG: imidazolonepropionase [Bacteroidota bacterium]